MERFWWSPGRDFGGVLVVDFGGKAGSGVLVVILMVRQGVESW